MGFGFGFGAGCGFGFGLELGLGFGLGLGLGLGDEQLPGQYAHARRSGPVVRLADEVEQLLARVRARPRVRDVAEQLLRHRTAALVGLGLGLGLGLG